MALQYRVLKSVLDKERSEIQIRNSASVWTFNHFQAFPPAKETVRERTNDLLLSTILGLCPQEFFFSFANAICLGLSSARKGNEVNLMLMKREFKTRA